MLDRKYKRSDVFVSKKISYSVCITDKLTKICFYFKDFQGSTDMIWKVLNKLIKLC